MCAVLDSGQLPEILGGMNDEYKPLINWILDSGMAIVGGSKYNKELKSTPKYLRFFARLKQSGKLISIPDEIIDERVINLKKIEPKSDFDDPHLVALIIESGCKVICTGNDRRSHKYIRDTKFYGKGKRPSIYSSKNHTNLLRPSNICGKCR